MFTYFKNDFSRVREAAQYLFPRLPLAVIVGWYVLMTPIGLILVIPVKIWYCIMLRNLKREIEDYSKFEAE